MCIKALQTWAFMPLLRSEVKMRAREREWFLSWLTHSIIAAWNNHQWQKYNTMSKTTRLNMPLQYMHSCFIRRPVEGWYSSPNNIWLGSLQKWRQSGDVRVHANQAYDKKLYACKNWTNFALLQMTCLSKCRVIFSLATCYEIKRGYKIFHFLITCDHKCQPVLIKRTEHQHLTRFIGTA